MATIYENLKKIFTTNKPRNNNKNNNITIYDKLSYTVYPKDRYDQLATEGYEQNAVVYRCVNEIANAASRVQIDLFRGNQEIEEHPILDLLHNPSPNYGQVEFFQAVYAYLLISGNSYLLQNGPDGGTPQELYPLRPDRIRIIPSGMGTVADAYNYMMGGMIKESYIVDKKTGRSRVKHIKLFNPLDDYYGLSPIMAASMDIDQHNLSNKHNVALLQNGARPSGAIVFKPKDDTGADIQLSETQRSQIISDLNQRFAGPNNAGRPMLLEGDFDWKSMGMSPKDMDFTQLKNFSARDIALVYGVPSQLVGVPDSQTYSNLAEARLALYTETVIPLMDRIQSDLNEWLTPQFGEDLELRYNIDSIPAMAEQRRRVFESVTSGVRDGILTRNEAREQLGYDRMEGADELLVPATLMPLNVATEQTPRDEDIPEEPLIDNPIADGQPVANGVSDETERVWGYEDEKELKKALPYQDLPLASKDLKWDAPEAKKRIMKWAGGDNWSSSKYSKAFMLVSGDGKNLGDYRLPYADIVDGSLKAIPKGIFAVAGAIAGARTGGMNITAEEKSKVQSQLKKYYAKLDMEPPFEKQIMKQETLNGKEKNAQIKN